MSERPPLAVREALDLLRARTEPLPLAAETVPIAQALGRVLAQDLVSTVASPPFDNAAVDGWAFAHASLARGPLRVRPGRAAAGHPFPQPLQPGEALRVLTGAVLPAGADTVAAEEICRIEDERLVVGDALAFGANRRRAAEDVAPGDRLLAQGQRLRPQDLGLAVQLGHARLPVLRRLEVALFSSGDELVEAGTAPGPGGIPDVNRPILQGLLERLGAVVHDQGILPDDRGAVARQLDLAARRHHAVVVSGGASKGDEDHVAATMMDHGQVDLWRLAIKPGRPLLVGRLGRTTVLGLPGNPVAATVAFARFARPVLLRLQGAPWSEPVALPLPAAFAFAKPPGRTEYLRGRLVAGPAVALIDKLGSNRLTSLADAGGLIELGPDVTEVAAGEPVPWLPFAELGLA